MVNGINGYVNFKEKTPTIPMRRSRRTETPPPAIMSLSREELEQGWDYRKLSWKPISDRFNRMRCGTYPKWIVSPVKKVLKHFFGPRVDIHLRGRGPRVSVAKKYGFRLNYDQDLPIKYAKKVAVYLTIRRLE